MSEIKTFQSVFPNSYFFAVRDPGDLNRQNIIFVGYNSNRKINFSNLEIKNNENPIIRNLKNKLINLDRFELSPYPILTDNFSPAENLISKFLEENPKKNINGEEMMSIITQQLNYGPRYPSAQGHKKIQSFLISEMKSLTQDIKIQSWQHTDAQNKVYELKNIIARFAPEKENHIIIGTHYDSKRFANKDLKNPENPVPGANDSASGVAALIEIARIFKFSKEKLDFGIDFVFFDGEEGEENQLENHANWKPLGSTYFSQNLNELYGEKKPVGAIVLDMVCDKDLKIFQEKASVENAPSQTNQFWDIAKKINPDVFVDKISPEIQDDHTPLNQVGIPSFLVIDFDYPPFHTTQDTLNKCSAESLETVANSVLKYIYSIN